MKLFLFLMVLLFTLVGCSDPSPSSLKLDSGETTIIKYSLGPTEIKKGARELLRVYAHYSDGSVQEMDKLWTYEYDGERVVGSISSGVLNVEQIDKKTVFATGLSEGEVSVRATLASTDGANGKIAESKIKVVSPFSLPNSSPGPEQNSRRLKVSDPNLSYRVLLPSSYAGKPIYFKFSPIRSDDGQIEDGGKDDATVSLDGSAKPNFQNEFLAQVLRKYMSEKLPDGSFLYSYIIIDAVLPQSGDSFKIYIDR